MRGICLVLLVLLPACGGPTPHFRGLPATRVTVEGSTFEVRRRGRLAEAVRVNPQYAPRLGPLRARAGRAIEAASGCRVEGALGDQAVVLGLLDCGESQARQGISTP